MSFPSACHAFNWLVKVFTLKANHMSAMFIDNDRVGHGVFEHADRTFSWLVTGELENLSQGEVGHTTE
jgi:hypothetical protein